MRNVVAIVCLALAAAGQAEIQNQMTQEEFEQAGLGKLSKQELAFLNRWLEQGSQTAPVAKPPPPAVPAVDPEERFGMEQVRQPDPAPEQVPERITARIQGEFRGWSGQTIFRLDNGQVWQQRVGGRYRSRKLENPSVAIEKGTFGYYLKVLDLDRSIGVRRVR